MTDERKPTATVKLTWPIDLDGGAQIAQLTFRRPKGKTIKRALALLGPELVKQVLAGEGPEKIDENAVRDALVKAASGLLTVDGLAEFGAIVGELCGQPAEVIDEVDPEDYPAIFGALAGFFPSLFSPGASSPQT